MKHFKPGELEGHAVAYALIIMQGLDCSEINNRLLREHGPNALRRVKVRAWQHVRANRDSGEVGK